MAIKMIWAQARSFSNQASVLGYHGDIPWHIPEDMKRFAQLTMSHPIVMGRTTWESFGTHKPLPHRTNIVVTRRHTFNDEGAVVAHSLLDALMIAQQSDGHEDIWIIGGGQLYKEYLSIADTIYITDVDYCCDADTFAPDLSHDSRWVMTEQGEWQTSVKNDQAPRFRYLTYQRQSRHPYRVLTVCTGNICRSPMAQIILQDYCYRAGLSSLIHIDSAGISDEEEGNPLDRRAQRVLQEHGYMIPSHHARQITQKDEQADLILPMTKAQFNLLKKRYHSSVVRPYCSFLGEDHWDDDLADPWYGDYSAFEEAFAQIKRVAPYILEWIIQQL